MASDRSANAQPGLLNDLGRAARAPFRPLTAAVSAAAEAGIGLERRVIDGLLDSGELERLLDSAAFKALVDRVLESDGAKHLIDTFFESSLFDRFVDRLLESDALWRLVDEVAASPSVTAAISQQGLGFADQVGGEVRSRSRKADTWLEHRARRLVHRHAEEPPAEPDPDS